MPPRGDDGVVGTPAPGAADEAAASRMLRTAALITADHAAAVDLALAVGAGPPACATEPHLLAWVESRRGQTWCRRRPPTAAVQRPSALGAPAALWPGPAAHRADLVRAVGGRWAAVPLARRWSAWAWALGDDAALPPVVASLLAEVRSLDDPVDPLFGPPWRGTAAPIADSAILRGLLAEAVGADAATARAADVADRWAGAQTTAHHRRTVARVLAVAAAAAVLVGGVAVSAERRSADLIAAAEHLQQWPLQGTLAGNTGLMSVVQKRMWGAAGRSDVRVVYFDQVGSRHIALGVDPDGVAHALEGPLFSGPALSWIIGGAISGWEYRRSEPAALPRAAVTAVVAQDRAHATLISVFPDPAPPGEPFPMDPIFEVAGFEGSWTDGTAGYRTRRYPTLAPAVRTTVTIEGLLPVTSAVRVRVAARQAWAQADFTWEPRS